MYIKINFSVYYFEKLFYNILFHSEIIPKANNLVDARHVRKIEEYRENVFLIKAKLIR